MKYDLLPLFLLSALAADSFAQTPLTVQTGTLGDDLGAGLIGEGFCGTGDLDGDGFGDFALGTPGANGNVGRITAISGRSLAPLWERDGTAAFPRIGVVLEGVDDLSGDGVPDLVAAGEHHDGVGATGRHVEVRSGVDGALIERLSTSATFLSSITSLGDIDCDGFGDFLIGDTGLNSVIAYSGQDRSVIYVRSGDDAGDWFGWAAAGELQLDADGVPDFAVGAPEFNDPSSNFGGYVRGYSGKTGQELGTIEGGSIWTLGWDVDGMGDMNGDQIDDLVIGSPEFSPSSPFVLDAGRVDVYSGTFDGSTLVPPVFGTATDEELGDHVAGLGDVDGDAVPDFLVTSEQFSFGGGILGYARVHSGADSSVIRTLPNPRGLASTFADTARSMGDLNDDGICEYAVLLRGEAPIVPTSFGPTLPEGSSLYVYSGSEGTFSSYGAGCNPGGVAPGLAITGLAAPNGSLAISISSAPLFAVGFVGIGLLPTAIPLGSGCNLLSSMDLTTVLFQVGAGGSALITAPVPASFPTPIAITFQAIVQSAVSPLGFAVTNGVSVQML